MLRPVGKYVDENTRVPAATIEHATATWAMCGDEPSRDLARLVSMDRRSRVVSEGYSGGDSFDPS